MTSKEIIASNNVDLSLIEISHLNNEAVYGLQPDNRSYRNNNNRDVRRKLSTALTRLKTLSSHMLMMDNELQQISSSVRCYQNVLHNEQRASMVLETQGSSPSDEGLRHDNEILFKPYYKFFLCSSDVGFDVASTTMIILYNFALFHHWKAVETSKQELYDAAIQLYRRLTDLLTIHRVLIEQSSTMRIVMSACLHNIAHCYATSSSKDYTTASFYHESLLKFLEWMDNQSLSLQSDDYEFFHNAINSLHVIIFSTADAA